MSTQFVVSGVLCCAGIVLAAAAVRNERRMQRHRQPGVGYAAVTLRRDGGWRRGDLFTAQGLHYQALAARYGFAATGLWILALLAWVVLGT